MRRRTVIATGAALTLIALDLFLLAVAFLYRPAESWIAAIAIVGVFAAAVALRRPWLVFIAQNIVTAILLYRLYQYSLLPTEQRANQNLTSLAVPIAAIVIGNFFAWLLARGLRARGADIEI